MRICKKVNPLLFAGSTDRVTDRMTALVKRMSPLMEELRNLFKTSDQNNSVDCPVEFRCFYDATVSTLKCSEDYFKKTSPYCTSCKKDKDKSHFEVDEKTKKRKASCTVLSVELTSFDRRCGCRSAWKTERENMTRRKQ